MAVRKLKGSWWVDFMYNGERLRKRSPHNSKGSAEAFEAHLRQLIAQHGSVTMALKAMEPKPEERVPTFVEFAERWMRDYVLGTNQSTTHVEKRHVLSGHLVPAFGDHRLVEIDALAIDQYKATKRAAGLAPKTINNHLTILRKALDTACDWKLLAQLPRIKFLPVCETTFKFLTPTQADTLIAAAPSGLWRAMITVALRTGMRFSELVALTWDAIDWTCGTHGTVTVRRKNVRGRVGPPKNNRIRHLPLTRDAAAELQGLVGPHPRGDTLVFTFEDRYVRYDTAWQHLARICQTAGVPRVSWHDLRHSFASHLASAGAPLKAVQDLMGHRTIEMTMRYAHLAPDVRHAAIALLEPLPPQRLSTRCQPVPVLASSATPAFALQGSNRCST